MKKYTILALVLVLSASLFAGCRDRNNVNNTTRPETSVTTTPTAATTRPTTQPTTETTRATTAPTTENVPETTENAPMDGTAATDGTNGSGDMEGRMRRTIPSGK